MEPSTSPRLLPPDLTSSGKSISVFGHVGGACPHTCSSELPSLTAEAVADAPVPYLLILLSLPFQPLLFKLVEPTFPPPSPAHLLFLPNNKISTLSPENAKPFLCWKRNLFKIRKNVVPLPCSCKNAGASCNHRSIDSPFR